MMSLDPRRWLLPLLVFGALAPVSGPASAKGEALVFQSANKNYYNGKYGAALKGWLGLAEAMGIDDPVLFHNIGNAWFRKGRYGEAIVAYRRGLDREPSGELHEALRRNLLTARRVLQNRYRSGGEDALVYSSPVGVVHQVSHLLPGNVVAGLFAAAWLLFFASLMLRRLSVSRARLGGRLAVGFSVALVLTGLLLAGRVLSDADTQIGVVVHAEAALKDGPHPTAQGRPLPEGLEVRLVQEVDGWRQVELVGGRRGWVMAAHVRPIHPEVTPPAPL